MSLRVTGGTLRSRHLARPQDRGIRPTAARVRESLFSIIGQNLSGLRVLDLFAGAGTLGIEAASRGAQQVVFVEKNRRHAKIVGENLDLLEGLAEVDILVMPADRALDTLAGRGDSFDLVFVDPPYDGKLAEQVLEALGGKHAAVVAEDGIVVVESASDEPLVDVTGSLQLDGRRRDYGSTRLSFYRKGVCGR